LSEHRPVYRNPFWTLLAWLGRQGSRAAAGLLIVGVVAPPLGILLRPLVPAAIFLLLTVSFCRLDMIALRNHLRRPMLVLAATAWTAIVVPLLFGLVALAFNLNVASPGLFLGVMLQGVTAPMMAAPAMAALAGLDATIVLITLVAGMVLVPLTAPSFAYLFLGGTLGISPPALAAKLAAMLAGSFVVAALGRRLAGAAAIGRHREAIDGVNILLMLIFVTAVMGDVAPRTIADPGLVTAIALLAFGTFLIVLFLTIAVFWRAGRITALSLGLVASQRNMGLMLAATGGALPGMAWLYFALSQFPIYLSPQFLRFVSARLVPAGTRD
jgi:predicted Na+-dependent transporter